ncbi:MAG: hypothetical protein ABI318_21380 [Chthoniobacteraceae bacterium]
MEKKKFIVRAAVGLSIQIASLVVGFSGYRIGMSRAHAALAASSSSATTNGSVISDGIDIVLYSLAAACAGVFFGLVIFICSFIAFRRAARSAE